MIHYVPFGVTKIFLNQQVKNGIVSKKVSILSIFAQTNSVSYQLQNLWYWPYRPPLIYTEVLRYKEAQYLPKNLSSFSKHLESHNLNHRKSHILTVHYNTQISI